MGSAQTTRLRELRHYFDAIECDRHSHGKQHRRLSEWLRVRDQLMKLPDAEFDQVMKAVRALLGDIANSEQPVDQALERRAARELMAPPPLGGKSLEATKLISKV